MSCSRKENPAGCPTSARFRSFIAPGVERIEVVDPHDLIALGGERLDQMGADEAGGAGDQDPSHLLARPIP